LHNQNQSPITTQKNTITPSQEKKIYRWWHRNHNR
jgi:hypothetical protein